MNIEKRESEEIKPDIKSVSRGGSRLLYKPTEFRLGNKEVIVYNADNFGSYIPQIIRDALRDHVEHSRPQPYLELTINDKTFQFLVSAGVVDALEFWEYEQENDSF